MATRKHYKRSGRRSRRVTVGGFFDGWFKKPSTEPTTDAQTTASSSQTTATDAEKNTENRNPQPVTVSTEPKVSLWDIVFGQKKPTPPAPQTGGRRKRRRTQRNRSAK